MSYLINHPRCVRLTEEWFWFICVTPTLSDCCSLAHSLSLSLSMCSRCLSASGPDSFCQSGSHLFKDKLQRKPTSFFITQPETLPVLSKQQKEKQLPLPAHRNLSQTSHCTWFKTCSGSRSRSDFGTKFVIMFISKLTITLTLVLDHALTLILLRGLNLI